MKRLFNYSEKQKTNLFSRCSFVHLWRAAVYKQPNMKQYQDKVVWITGASSGIGEALAVAFAQAGARVAISARNVAELERVKAACPDPRAVLVVPLDVADYAHVGEVAQQVLTHFGYISILVNNAGISQRGLVKDTVLAVDERVMAVNFMGTVAVTKAVLPAMLQQRYGQIVVISSVMGKIGTPMRSAYAASKHALHGFFECLRAEVADSGVGVTIICPGYVNTNVTVNALTADGTPKNEKSSDTVEGLSPEAFAQKALRAIAAGKPEAIIGGKEVLGIYLNRFFPSLLRRLVRGMKVE
jgi:short-subunit dehydrogenase